MNANMKVNLSRACIFALALMASATCSAWYGGGGWHGGVWHGGGGGWHGPGWGGSGRSYYDYAPPCYTQCNGLDQCRRYCNY